ncbi:uncharacterized protein EI90DRAFT_3064231 [Cantharellus anzutake]|uniref:uncharacterized protein n=1 Tax=Cantharellus anzutake TaxID=1750568 RepID=UPI001905FEA4|nr:uncharacterized protein EI90DRAFT_3064231 [Cantharellus anzutake]KAF8328680.1 hypothetical protein EI90DRAFT_3064231 [Cantharellus anzutake]
MYLQLFTPIVPNSVVCRYAVQPRPFHNNHLSQLPTIHTQQAQWSYPLRGTHHPSLGSGLWPNAPGAYHGPPPPCTAPNPDQGQSLRRQRRHMHGEPSNGPSSADEPLAVSGRSPNTYGAIGTPSPRTGRIQARWAIDHQTAALAFWPTNFQLLCITPTQ